MEAQQLVATNLFNNAFNYSFSVIEQYNIFFDVNQRLLRSLWAQFWSLIAHTKLGAIWYRLGPTACRGTTIVGPKLLYQASSCQLMTRRPCWLLALIILVWYLARLTSAVLLLVLLQHSPSSRLSTILTSRTATSCRPKDMGIQNDVMKSVDSHGRLHCTFHYSWHGLTGLNSF